MYQVFLIDDEPWVLIGMQRLIVWEDYGFEVTGTSTSSKNAWEQILEKKPDVVITDIRMPGQSGIDLLKKIRNEGLNTYVILVSGFMEFEYAREALKEGAFDYLVKQVSREQLASCMQRLYDEMEKKRQEQDAMDTLEMILKYKENCTAEDFLADNGKTTSQEEEYYIACLYTCTQDMVISKAIGKTSDRLTGRIVQVARNQLLAVLKTNRKMDFFVTRQLESWREQLEFGTQKETGDENRKSIIYGVSTYATKNKSVKKMMYEAEIACLSAMFVGKTSMQYKEEEIRWEKQAELLRQISYHQNKQIRSLLDELRWKVECGDILLNALWRYYQNIEYEYVEANEGKPLLEPTCESHQDIVLHYKDSLTFFEALKRPFEFDENSKILEQVREQVECHYMENMTVAALSSSLGISQGYLSQIVKKEMGKSYSELIQEKRLQKAKELLQYSDLSVAQIAQDVGFSDYYYFTKTFKRQVGSSPSDFRKEIRKSL